MLFTALQWMAAMFVALVVLQHVLGPWLVWRAQWAPEHYRFTPLDPDAFMRDRNETFRHLHAEMLALGFAYAGSSSLPMSNAGIFFSVYAHPEEGLAGMLVTASSAIGEITYVDFTQAYADGSVLTVYNAPLPPTYPPSRYKWQLRFPDIDSPAILHERLLRLRDHASNSARPVAFPVTGALSKLGEFMDREVLDLAERGWYASCVSGGKRRLTLKGACLMTWKNCWPWKPLLDGLDQRRARQAWATVGP